jgi:putative membrane protein
MWHDGFGWFSFGWLWMILFWGIIIGLIVWAITRFSKRDGSESRNNALDIAKERYAKGEISKEEFDQLKKDLS